MFLTRKPEMDDPPVLAKAVPNIVAGDSDPVKLDDQTSLPVVALSLIVRPNLDPDIFPQPSETDTASACSHHDDTAPYSTREKMRGPSAGAIVNLTNLESFLRTKFDHRRASFGNTRGNAWRTSIRDYGRIWLKDGWALGPVTRVTTRDADDLLLEQGRCQCSAESPARSLVSAWRAELMYEGAYKSAYHDGYWRDFLAAIGAEAGVPRPTAYAAHQTADRSFRSQTPDIGAFSAIDGEAYYDGAWRRCHVISYRGYQTMPDLAAAATWKTIINDLSGISIP